MNYTETNKTFFEDEYYTEEVRNTIRAYTELCDTYGTSILDKADEITTDDEYKQDILSILAVLNAYTTHFVANILPRASNYVNVVVFMQLKEKYDPNVTTLDNIRAELEDIENSYTKYVLVCRPDGEYFEQLIGRCDEQKAYQMINSVYQEEIYPTDDKYFENGKLKNLEEYYNVINHD